MQVVLDIPDDLVPFLVPGSKHPARAILEDATAEAYREGRLTMHIVGRLLDLPTDMEVDAFLGERKIYDLSVEQFEKELASLDHAVDLRKQESAA